MKDSRKERAQKVVDGNLPGGKLFICATPIGNLDDASFRLIETLENADLIIAEDTRTIRKILTRYNIKRLFRII